MYSSPSLKNRSNRANAYLVNAVMESSQEELLLKLYDFALTNCQLKNIEKTNKALNELIFALRFDTEELENISEGLYKLYDYCKDQMRKRNYDIVYKILSGLREQWAEVFHRN